VSPRSLDVRPTFRKRRLWPWVAAVAVLLVVAVAEFRACRRSQAGAGASATEGSSRSTVAGRVLTAEGKPVGGVAVVAAPGGVEAHTGADGRFSLALETGTTVLVSAHHSDLGFASAEVRPPAPELELRLAPRAGVEVHVLSDGRPVPGARVWVQNQVEGVGTVRFDADRTTDAAGALRFLGLPEGRLVAGARLDETGAESTAVVDTREGVVSRLTLVLPPVRLVR
jgi:hypothetical protein